MHTTIGGSRVSVTTENSATAATAATTSSQSKEYVPEKYKRALVETHQALLCKEGQCYYCLCQRHTAAIGTDRLPGIV